MPKKSRDLQFPVVLATVFVAVVGVVAIVLVHHTHDPDYWISDAALLLPMVLAVAGKTRRPADSPTVDHIDEEAAKLRDSVLQQWTGEVELRTLVYPLQVPFSTAAEVTESVTVQAPGGETRNPGGYGPGHGFVSGDPARP